MEKLAAKAISSCTIPCRRCGAGNEQTRRKPAENQQKTGEKEEIHIENPDKTGKKSGTTKLAKRCLDCASAHLSTKISVLSAEGRILNRFDVKTPRITNKISNI